MDRDWEVRRVWEDEQGPCCRGLDGWLAYLT